MLPEQSEPKRLIPVSCTMCRFFSPNLHAADGTGVCRRHAPKVFLIPNGTVSAMPTVKPSDWCAEGEAGMSGDSIAAGKNVLDKKNGKH